MAWTAQRRLAIFATDAAAAAGLSRFSDPHMLYLEKLGLVAPKVQTAAMRWGSLLEGVIATEWARETGRKVRKDGYTYWRRDLPFPMATHLDYRTADGDLVEIKTAGQHAAADYGEQGTDEVPIDYRLQCVHEMLVTGAPACHLVVLIGGNQPRHYLIGRDAELEDSLLKIEQRAWEGVVARTPPAIDGSAGSAEYIRQAYPEDNGEVLELDENLQDLGMSYVAAKAQEKAAGEQVADLGNRLRAALGSASGASGGGITVAYRKSADRKEIAWEAVARSFAASPDYAAAVAANTTVKPGIRPLIVKYREA